MKAIKITLAMILGLLTFHSFGSDLNLRLFNNSRFYVVFDGQVYSDFSSDFNIYNVAPGNHSLQVVKLKNGYYGHGNSYGHGAEISVFAGNIFLPANMLVNAVIDNFNRFTIVSQFPLRPRTYEPYTRPGGNCRHDAYNNYYDRNYNGMYSEDFNRLLGILDKASFESSRLDILRTAAAMNYFTSVQVREILLTFDFESNRITAAKMLYPRVVDKERFYLVYDSFDFSFSISEMNRWIAGYR